MFKIFKNIIAHKGIKLFHYTCSQNCTIISITRRPPKYLRR